MERVKEKICCSIIKSPYKLVPIYMTPIFIDGVVITFQISNINPLLLTFEGASASTMHCTVSLSADCRAGGL